MKTIKHTLILDDEATVLTELQSTLTQTVLKMGAENILTADNTETAFELIRQHLPELFFVDMELRNDIASEGNDFIEDIAKYYKKYGYKKMPFIAVITGYMKDYAKLLQPLQNENWFLGYFVKPTSTEEFNKAFLRKLHSQTITITWKGEGRVIPVENIAYLEKESAGGKNLFIYEWNGKSLEQHTMRIPLGKFLEEHLWNHPDFEQTHSAYAVQAAYVEAWDKASNLILKQKEGIVPVRVPVSDTHKKRLKKERGWFR